MDSMQQLSPLRNTTQNTEAIQLAREQAEHFGIDPESGYGQTLVELATHLYLANQSVHELWQLTLQQLSTLDRSDRIAWFNAKRFVSFQLAKVLDNLQNPARATYQSLTPHQGQFAAKGAYPVFDNITAIFSASPVITRTATYLFACTEWVEDAFKGKEPLHEIYSRLLNPTSISLANHIIDLEAGANANQYMAWNFNSGMAAIDGILSHLLGYRDIIIASRNVYGGTYQLMHDWYARQDHFDVALIWVDGFDAEAFEKAFKQAEEQYRERIAAGHRVCVYLESPCNPHGYVLDVAEICARAHQRHWTVITDTTVGTPFLHPVLKCASPAQRPDFVIHSYTKELAGTGSTTAGVVIGRNEAMFIPKGEKVTYTAHDGVPRELNWNESMFWNVYYIKGAFLDADKAFEVLNGMKTYELRLLQKAINTTILARVFTLHPDINVSCPVLADSPNHPQLLKIMYLGLPASLFTIDMEGKLGRKGIDRTTFKQFFDILEPAIGMQVSLGQTNTVALCPALTTHSELSDEALNQAGIKPTTLRISVGLEDPRVFIAHIQNAARITFDHHGYDFSEHFPSPEQIDTLYRQTYLEIQKKFIAGQPSYRTLSK